MVEVSVVIPTVGREELAALGQRAGTTSACDDVIVVSRTPLRSGESSKHAGQRAVDRY